MINRFLWLSFLVLCVLAAAPHFACALTAEEAYRAIPHRQTVFDFASSRLPDEDRIFLKQFLNTVELAMIERVEMMQWLQSGGRQGAPGDGYEEVLDRLKAFRPPEKLAAFQSLVIEAVELQRAFLREWQAKGGAAQVSINDHPNVRSASSKLQQAYGLLMNLFPDETTENKQAFFDYLCALDFI